MSQPTSPTGSTHEAHCANCGTPLQGAWCYQCGQEAHDPMQRFRSAFGELFENILHFDNRIWNTLLPLLVRPGFLTREYLAGRRIRYVAPLRLTFFLALATFFVWRLILSTTTPLVVASPVQRIDAASTAAEVTRIRNEELQSIDQALRERKLPMQAQGELRALEQSINVHAQQRLRVLASAPANTATARFPVTAPLSTLASAPRRASEGHNHWRERLRRNLVASARNPDHLLVSTLHVLPQTLLVLMPVFALLLKLFFPGRLYAEHLIVALHSHAFALLDLLLYTLLDLAATAARPVPLLAWPLGMLATLCGWWLVVYPLLMQKRVYGQRWSGAVLSYLGIGAVYSVLLAIALLVSLGIGAWR